jgi:hypothetical protein
MEDIDRRSATAVIIAGLVAYAQPVLGPREP